MVGQGCGVQRKGSDFAGIKPQDWDENLIFKESYFVWDAHILFLFL